MKITYDKVSNGYSYPLKDRKELVRLLGDIPGVILSRIKKIRFGCNWSTTQEARIVQRGQNFDIKINFSLKDKQSPLLSEKKNWINTIKKFGGKINKTNNTVLWDLESARKYSYYLIFHEIGHVAYCIQKHGGKMNGKKGSSSEEQWCDKFAFEAVNKYM